MKDYIICKECRKKAPKINPITRGERSVYCSRKCNRLWGVKRQRKLYVKRSKIKSRACRECCKEFITTKGEYICSNSCREARQEARDIKRRKTKPVPKVKYADREVVELPALREPVKEKPRGDYVYGWYHPESPLPFYVGKGSGNRAWIVHRLKSGELAFCQLARSSKTRVVIYRDNLTVEGASLVESVLKKLFESMGAPLTNESETLARQEIIPLEL